MEYEVLQLWFGKYLHVVVALSSTFTQRPTIIVLGDAYAIHVARAIELFYLSISHIQCYG